MRIQAQILTNHFNDLSISQQFQIVYPVVKYVLIPFEGEINPGGPQGVKLYLQGTKYIYKEGDKLNISVSNAKDIIYHFISLSNKYGWGSLEFTV